MPRSEFYRGGAGNLEGRYANYFEIGHNAFEFLLDFGQFYDGEAEADLTTRIITSPVYAKALARVLHQAITQYEQNYGPLPDEPDAPEAADEGGPSKHTTTLQFVKPQA